MDIMSIMEHKNMFTIIDYTLIPSTGFGHNKGGLLYALKEGPQYLGLSE